MSQRIEKCEAIALKVTEYSNTSQIIQFFSKKFGHVGVIAKGTRNPKNNYYGLLQQLGRYEMVIYKKENTLSLLKEINQIDDYAQISSNYEIAALAHAGAELYLQLIFEEDDYEKFYELLKQFYEFIPSVSKNHILVFWRFVLRVASFLGFSLKFDKCTVCSTKDKETFHGISFIHNGFICANCSRKRLATEHFQINESTRDLLLTLRNLHELESFEIAHQDIQTVNTILKTYLSHHLHKKIHLRSLEVL
ncbi:MAG TPA: DNA repair protein RecO [Candidatus Cloacimonetes bacterium]|nr:DNA repair protein RecO [Candidatus Cloacimonadota bacterium]